MRPRSSSLHLPRPGLKADLHARRGRPKRPRRGARWRQASIGVLLLLGGSGILALLMQLPSRIDALLIVSKAIVNLIQGLMQLGMALVQLAVVLAVVLLALLALLLLIGGGMRLLRAAIPGRTPPLPPPLR